MKKKYNIGLLNGTICSKNGQKVASLGIKDSKNYQNWKNK